MKLELKHLAPYLPYGLKWTMQEMKTFVMQGITKSTLFTEEGAVLNWQKHEDLPQALFPILRPLDDLTKEIEFDGKKIIPIMVLFGGENYTQYQYTIDVIGRPIAGKRIDISVVGLGSPCVSFYLKNPLSNTLPFHNFEDLFSWHFDLFKLIEKGLAIDINTLGGEAS